MTEEQMLDLLPGDIFATEGKGIVGWVCRRVFTPDTDRFHHGLLWQKTADNDWITLESIGRGITVSRLSEYKDRDIKFYRVNCPDDIRDKVCQELTKWGRYSYDYRLIIKIGFGILRALLRNLFKGKFSKITADNLPYSKDAHFICIEAVDLPYYHLGFAIIPPTRMPLPSAVKQAESEDKITEIKSEAPD
ncbi:MAG: hypothetical protein HYY80_05390 [Chloroflexi bacterium]|nr:hypothetical protein [Chloroflexota bacterium]